MTTEVLLLIVSFVLADLHLCLPTIAKFIVRRRASKLPPALGERMREEWIAEIDANPSHLLKLWFALGLFRGIADLIRADREQAAKEASLNVVLRAEQGRLYDGAKARGLSRTSPSPQCQPTWPYRDMPRPSSWASLGSWAG
jgi:hypothetical protein